MHARPRLTAGAATIEKTESSHQDCRATEVDIHHPDAETISGCEGKLIDTHSDGPPTVYNFPNTRSQTNLAWRI